MRFDSLPYKRVYISTCGQIKPLGKLLVTTAISHYRHTNGTQHWDKVPTCQGKKISLSVTSQGCRALWCGSRMGKPQLVSSSSPISGKEDLANLQTADLSLQTPCVGYTYGWLRHCNINMMMSQLGLQERNVLIVNIIFYYKLGFGHKNILMNALVMRC